jgi:hypothetical protein
VRHYQLVPVRYNAQQLLTRCEPIDAELWSIQWTANGVESYRSHPHGCDIVTVTGDRMHWFADVAPLERDNAEAIVTWLNGREQMLSTLPPLSDVVPFNRSK